MPLSQPLAVKSITYKVFLSSSLLPLIVDILLFKTLFYWRVCISYTRVLSSSLWSSSFSLFLDYKYPFKRSIYFAWSDCWCSFYFYKFYLSRLSWFFKMSLYEISFFICSCNFLIFRESSPPFCSDWNDWFIWSSSSTRLISNFLYPANYSLSDATVLSKSFIAFSDLWHLPNNSSFSFKELVISSPNLILSFL